MRNTDQNSDDNYLEELITTNRPVDTRRKLYAVARGGTIDIFTKLGGPEGAQESVLDFKNNFHT
eukprot:1552844-Ditylum_brightwellii.AAC.1